MEACADGPGDDFTDSPTSPARICAAQVQQQQMEEQEKNKALSDHQKITLERDQAIHSYEQLKKEHIGLRQNNERMYSQALALQQVRYNVLCDQ